jgi:prepilin-type N-terminal cleavage/methylation domain-containing protein
LCDFGIAVTLEREYNLRPLSRGTTMLSQPLVRGASNRRGFTLIELLVALALIVTVMALLTEGFAAAAQSFRDLKAIGDQNEKLRGTAVALRRDLADAHFDAARLAADGLRTGKVDREEVADLRARYEALAADVDAFDAELQEVEPKLETPAEKRIVRRVRGHLDRLKTAMSATTDLLELIETDDDDK